MMDLLATKNVCHRNRNLTVGQHDALVLVHPTNMKCPRSSPYQHRILDAVSQARSHNIPVFVVPSHIQDRWLEGKLAERDLVEMPNRLANTKGVKRRVLRKRLQYEVDFIARTLAIPPAEICIGLGGMYAAACVFGVAQSWCMRIQPLWPDWVDKRLRSWLPKHPIGRGEVLEDLVLGFNDYEYVD